MTNETKYEKQIEAIVEDQKQMVAKHGWYSHGVIPQADVDLFEEDAVNG